jgi:hypothetical protein
MEKSTGTGPRIPRQRQPEKSCQPWCTNHDDEGGFCYAANIAIPGGVPSGGSVGPHVGLGQGPEDEPRIDIYQTGEPVTVDDAERIALAILVQVARGRGLTPAPETLAAVTA